MLTTTMPYMGVVVKALKEAGLRKDLVVLVGGDVFCPGIALPPVVCTVRRRELVGAAEVAGDDEDVEVAGAEGVGKAEEGLDAGDVALVEDRVDCSHGHVGVDRRRGLRQPTSVHLPTKPPGQI